MRLAARLAPPRAFARQSFKVTRRTWAGNANPAPKAPATSMRPWLLGAGGLAAAIGSGTAAVVACDAADGGAEASVPPFSLTKPRFDQSTFMGRYRSFLQSTDCRTLLIGDDALADAKALLAAYKDGAAPEGTTDAQLWDARRIKEAICHPDNGEKIFPLFRFSAFAPANIPICVWLMWPGASAVNAVVAQWFNQSYNVAVNFANRNMSNPMPMDVVAKSYALACGTSCGIAVALGKLMKSPAMGRFGLLARLVPWAAVCTAGCVNCVFVRWGELSGIDVTDETGEVALGRSAAAGKDAIQKCCAARVIWTTPVLMGVPLMMAPLSKLGALKRSPRLAMAAEIAIVVGLLFSVVPAALAVFPQRDSLAVEDVEPEVRAKAEAAGCTRIYFNKGL